MPNRVSNFAPYQGANMGVPLLAYLPYGLASRVIHELLKV